MTSEDLADKITARVEYMLLQHIPKPTCATKQAAHKAEVMKVKKLIAERIYNNQGLNITISV